MARATLPRKSSTPRRRNFSADRAWSLVVLAPSVVMLAIFVYGFIARSGYLSLTDWGNDPVQALSLNPVIKFTGFDNYANLFTGFLETRFRQDLVSTLFFTVFFIAACLGLGLGLAMLLDRNPRGEGLWRTIFLFPMSLSFIVTGTIWRWMLQPSGGVNALFGLDPNNNAWLTSSSTIWSFDFNKLPLATAFVVGLVLLVVAWRAWTSGDRTRTWTAVICAALLFLWALTFGNRVQITPAPEPHGFNLAFIGIVVAAVWQMSGYTMALYLAGLRGIPDELREAARVDGAGEWGVYRHVIFPLLSPITLSAMIILGHISLKIFDLVYAMTGLNNLYTEVPALYLYITAFQGNQFAKGAAIGMVLLVLVAAVIVPYLASQFRRSDRA
ncbi:carbohydrate ABC transporter permease [Deinococcus yavapaiensis]|uniref:Glucose ABC transporter membrane protein /mannose ABC transporter membrane protein n=1 Tax=Deinococcus yavapaiensis KR-236 TaxID=694435 RepID=A0A318SNR7_9DEIO|nr:sugar ABC transporter permease [Deinococcus yavapaiensis]PYE54390.1 glucose ABC transporter membrane protein /mannose ABC transporter membrane protein [Deinococcus yavapaiensis KR-236]